MIRAKIEEYRVTKDNKVLDEIKEAATTSKTALAFLFTVEPENYKDALTEAAKEIALLGRDAEGLFSTDVENQEELLLSVMPLYTLYETKCNKKENYIDLVEQCKAAVKKYPGSKVIFSMLAEVLEYFSEEIFEHYKTVQRLLWEQYVAVSVNPDATVAYALAKACFYKAFLLEKYEDALSAFADEKYPAAYYAIKRLEKRFERN
jgi:histidyl-tRNA synthetase